MKCDRCHEKSASIRITQTVNGQTEELHLCRDCSAKMQAEYAKHSWSKLFQDNFFGSWLGGTGGIPSFGAEGAAGPVLRCDTCGTSYDDFRRTGLFGCTDCYRSFKDNLDKVFLRVQGGARHSGRTARGYSLELSVIEQIKDLRDRQQAAILAEDYETAASLRDELRDLEAGVMHEAATAGEDELEGQV